MRPEIWVIYVEMFHCVVKINFIIIILINKYCKTTKMNIIYLNAKNRSLVRLS